jgi:hypothetical protein
MQGNAKVERMVLNPFQKCPELKIPPPPLFQKGELIVSLRTREI